MDANLFNNETVLTDYKADVWRSVESQVHAATLSIVDDFAEQDLLEQMLDAAKPRYREGTEGMHYLLKSAFRYPPLPWGSRFGGRHMPSYFYASEQIDTALSECAYYRFVFLQDMRVPYEKAIRSEYVLFNVRLQSKQCLDLTAPTYDAVRAAMSDPTSYAASQHIGAWAYDRAAHNDVEGARFEGVSVDGDSAENMNDSQRNSEPGETSAVQMLRFGSVRAPEGINVAVMEPGVIRSAKPKEQQRWLCLTKADTVSFSSRESDVSYLFNKRDFCDEQGRFLRVTT